jgi:hypothetical protein
MTHARRSVQKMINPLGVGSACVGLKARLQPCNQAVRLDEIETKTSTDTDIKP